MWKLLSSNPKPQLRVSELEQIKAELAEIKALLVSSKTILNPEEACIYLGIKLPTLYKLTSAGVIPYSKPNGKLLFFSRKSLDEWILSTENPGMYKREIQACTYLTTIHDRGNRKINSNAGRKRADKV